MFSSLHSKSLPGIQQNNGTISIEILYLVYGINPNHFNRGSNEFELSSVKFKKWHHLCATYASVIDEQRFDLALYLDGGTVNKCEEHT